MSTEKGIDSCLALRRLLCERKITAETLAHWADLNKGHLSALLRGKYSPTLRTLDRLAEALDVDVKDLL